MKNAKLTSNASETQLGGLLMSDAEYAIPYFQREYKWEKPRLNQLERDLLKVVDVSQLAALGAEAALRVKAGLPGYLSKGSLGAGRSAVREELHTRLYQVDALVQRILGT